MEMRALTAMVLEKAYTPHFVCVPKTEVQRRRLEDVPVSPAYSLRSVPSQNRLW